MRLTDYKFTIMRASIKKEIHHPSLRRRPTQYLTEKKGLNGLSYPTSPPPPSSGQDRRLMRQCSPLWICDCRLRFPLSLVSLYRAWSATFSDVTVFLPRDVSPTELTRSNITSVTIWQAEIMRQNDLQIAKKSISKDHQQRELSTCQYGLSTHQSQRAE